MAKPLNIANKLANMMNGSKPKQAKQPDTFQEIGKKLAVKKPTADAIRKGMSGKK